MGTRLDGKTALVTGAGSGFGAGILRRLIEEGARVLAVDVNEEGLAAIASETGAIPHRADVADSGSIAAMAAAASSISPRQPVSRHAPISAGTTLQKAG